MTEGKTVDAYRVLQVDPSAHQVVIRAAYLALARRYHPDGDTPDPIRMADLNHAYDLLRDEQRRRLYDARRAVLGATAPGPSVPVGPGQAAAAGSASERQPAGVAAGATNSAANGAAGADTAGPFHRARRPDLTGPGSTKLDFGRYAGWSLRDLARHDPDYLRWLSRHSSGLRYRTEIGRLLPADQELGRRGT